MSTTTLQLDQFVDPFEARVIYQRDESGAIVSARFDLAGLPRLDPMLIGREVATVPDVVKRLCGICPVTHHLAGVRALDMLYGAKVPETARLVRGLLNDGSILDAIAPRLFAEARELAIQLKKIGKLAMSAAGSPGHFPDVAIPGGVRAPADAALCTELAKSLPDLIAQVEELEVEESWTDSYRGLSVALQRNGALDPLGDSVALSDGRVLTVAEFGSLVRETKPGDIAPRPVIGDEPYRVGPIAHGAIAGDGWGPLRARKEMLISCLQRIERTLQQPALTSGTTVAPGEPGAGEGIGLVEGPRGLLVHRYVADGNGTLIECQILTPTAQNEGWLADMLRQSLASSESLEGSIRAADPCLPITQAPSGAMGITIQEED